MLNKMSQTQCAILQAAAARQDRCLSPPANARASAVKALAGKLIEAGWVKEVKARDGAPVWRKEEPNGANRAMKLTAAGLKAASEMTVALDSQPAMSISVPVAKAVRRKGRTTEAPKLQATATTPAQVPGDDVEGAPPTLLRAPRADTKLGQVLRLLTADAGATIGELTTATGWLEHTTRAALTGLRHRGFALSLARKERNGASVYRIAAPVERAAP